MPSISKPTAYQELVDAIVSAVPELQGVHEGCYLTGNGYHNTGVLIIHANHPFLFCATVYRAGHGILEKIDFDKREMKISPRELGVEDVLRALDFWKTRIAIDCDGQFWRILGRIGEPWSAEIAHPIRWKLGLPLSEQSDATKLFLISLLCQ